MSRKRVLLVAAIASALSAGAAATQEIGRPEHGLGLAQQICGQCHAVRKDQERSPNERAPRFQTIASVPGMTSIALSAALNTSHRSMPNIILSAEEKADIIAYILTLR